MSDIVKNTIPIHWIEETKYKVTTIGLLIRVPLTKETVTKNALLVQVLKQGCKKYPSRRCMNQKLEELEGSIFDSSILKKGNYQILFFYLEVLTKGSIQEDLLNQGIEFLQEVLLRPLSENQEFSKEIVDRQKKTLSEHIKQRIDDKREYAAQRCLEILYENAPFGIYAQGYEEDLDAIDEKNLYQHYQQLLKTAQIEIFVCGKKEKGQIVEKLASFFPENKPVIGSQSFYEWERYEGKTITENQGLLQGKLCIALPTNRKSTGQEFFSIIVLNEILGGGASSKLFNHVREKEGLCYYISSSIYRFPMVMLIEAGINQESLQKTVELVQKTIKELSEGDFTKEEQENAVTALKKKYLNISDSPTAQMDFSYSQNLLGVKEGLEEFLTGFDKVTKDDIITCAKGLALELIYFLQ